MKSCDPNSPVHSGALLLLLLLAGGPASAPAQAPAAANPSCADAAWASVPAILQRIVPPVFPKRDFDITRFGATAAGADPGAGAIRAAIAVNTGAIRAAIAACHEAGGGRVVVPAGQFHTGPVHLRSNVELRLSAGAELIFSDRFEDYLPPVLVRVGGVELYNYSPLIYARDAVNIAITGPGKLNGNPEAWWAWRRLETRRGFEMGAQGVPVGQRVFGTPEAAIRPSFVSFVSCTNILLEGFTIGSGPNWTIHPVYCVNLTVRRVHVNTYDGPNNDGLNPDSSRDVLIEDSVFDTGDDAVALKSGYNEDGWRVGRPTENVILRRNHFRRGHGGLVIGSEMSGDVRNVFMEDCVFDGTDRAVRIKSRADRGGVVENIFARNLRARNMRREVVGLYMDYRADRSQMTNLRPPRYRNIVIQNVIADGAPRAVLIAGHEQSPIENIRFENMTIASTRGVIVSHARGLAFDGVKVAPAGGPVFDLAHARDITIHRAAAPAGTDVFLNLAGANSANVRVTSSDLSAARQRFATGPGVAEGAVTVD